MTPEADAPAAPAIGTIRVQAGTWDLSVLTAGPPAPHGLAIVYLAGFIVGGHSAEPLTRALGHHYRVYAPDLPGYGHSPGPGATLTQAHQAQVLHQLLAALGLSQVVLVANSFSAQIAVEFAVAFPTALEHLVLVAPGVDSHGRTPFHQLARFIRNSWREDAWVAGMTGDFVRAGPRRNIETALYALRYRMEHRLPLVQAHTLVVRGERDVIVPHRWVEEVTMLLPHGRLVEVPTYAHGLERAGAEPLARLISRFIEGEG
jgi:2-hydroxy-6-oxonona-2,4-dienedioate hydrolase